MRVGSANRSRRSTLLCLLLVAMAAEVRRTSNDGSTSTGISDAIPGGEGQRLNPRDRRSHPTHAPNPKVNLSPR